MTTRSSSGRSDSDVMQACCARADLGKKRVGPVIHGSSRIVNGLGLIESRDGRGILGSKESRNEASEFSCLIFNAMAMITRMSSTPAAGEGQQEKGVFVSSGRVPRAPLAELDPY